MYKYKPPYNKPWPEQLKEIANGTHPQFCFDTEKKIVMCKCGAHAVKLRDGYLCSTITVLSNCPY